MAIRPMDVAPLANHPQPTMRPVGHRFELTSKAATANGSDRKSAHQQYLRPCIGLLVLVQAHDGAEPS